MLLLCWWYLFAQDYRSTHTIVFDKSHIGITQTDTTTYTPHASADSDSGGVQSSESYVTLFLLVWAFAVCISRLALGRHYVSDVLAGCVVGLVEFWASWYVACAVGLL
eukprot:TRINITY_DN4993_c0_g1_i2.p1 TRINITY_DN4993_c0_g1~~TRINITY_DN4993_c0_g1_i2.p1  ORF type:complete len:108 (-),score=19.94 TRINITY_DN4993_c0_g1_i2:207-530(-)